MHKVAALVSGGGTNLQAIIDAKIPNVEVALVISTNDHAYALKRAEKHGIESIVLTKKIHNREEILLNVLKERNIDLVVMCGCMMVLSAGFVGDWDKPIINVHPALLPKFGGKGFYGLAVHEAVLAAGESVTGATVHFVDDGIDTGSIILQRKVAVQECDTPETLQKRVMKEAEWQILPEAIDLLLNGE